MKKIILTTLMIVFGISLGIGVTAQAKQLWEYGVFSDRATVAENIGIENYEGTYAQNLLLLEWYENQFDQELILGSTLPIAGSTYTLAGSGITSSGASITLQSFTIPQNGYEIQDSDLSDTFYITLEPGSTKRQEIVSCTTVAQNANDTATLSGCTRGLSPITPFTTSSTLKFAHAGGTQVIFSDPPQLFNEYISLANNETVTGKKTFNVLPESSLLATTTNQFTIKSYVDNLINQGASTSTDAVAGISELATRVENASSTAWGVNSPHVQQSQHASSTPSDNAFTDGVVWDIWSENDGYLSQLWLDLSEAFTWTGLHSFEAGLLATASSTMSDLTVYGNTTTTNATTTGSLNVNNKLTFGTLISSTTDFGVFTATSSITARNIDQTVTLGWKPKLIKIDYYVSGATALNTNQYKQGVAYFSGTALLGGYTYTCDGGTDPTSTCSAASFGITLPDGTPTLVAGTGSAGADDVSSTISIQSVSDTGFVWRCAVDPGAGDASETGYCRGFYSAYR